MSYEVRTPLVVESIEAARLAIAGIKSRTMDAKEASALIGAAGRLQTAVSVDIKARLAAPKIAAQEAKVIETGDDRAKMLDGRERSDPGTWPVSTRG